MALFQAKWHGTSGICSGFNRFANFYKRYCSAIVQINKNVYLKKKKGSDRSLCCSLSFA